jgi:hypothetical protein
MQIQDLVEVGIQAVEVFVFLRGQRAIPRMAGGT